MRLRVPWTGSALFLLLAAATACSGVQVVRASPGLSPDAARAAATECAEAAGLAAHEEVDLEVNAAAGGYGDRIRQDPELWDIFVGDFAEVWVYARDDRYEIEVRPTTSSASSDRAVEEIERCLRENLTDTDRVD